VAQLFPRRFAFWVQLSLIAVAISFVSWVFLWRWAMANPVGIHAPIEQPVPFSHKHHVGDDGIDCRYCHQSVEQSAFAGIPPLSTCMTCHSQLYTHQKPLAPLLAAFESGVPLHWQRVYKLPDFVYFNHGIHIAKGIGCASCHGPVDEMPLMARNEHLSMQWCLACHRDPEKHLRPRNEVFNLHWHAKDQLALGRRLVRDNQGRPTKVEGNPQHPASLGSTDIFAQAAILQLWDPDRSQSVMHGNSVATWDDFTAALTQRITRFRANGGDGLRLLVAPTTSPTLIAQLAAFERRFPNARWHVDDPSGVTARREVARCRFDRAKVIVSLDADFLSDPAAGVRHSRDFIAARDPEHGDAMSRLYVVEPTPGVTGSMADHRLPLASREIEAFATGLAARLGGNGGPASDAAHAHWMDAVAKDLAAHRGTALVVAGDAQPEYVQSIARSNNEAHGGIRSKVD
jgi:hypothetical protein